MTARSQNERKFGSWEARPDGGRLYSLDVAGKLGWRARYLKMVDREEKTIFFWQEIFDEAGRLVEIHHKYPVDRGHERPPSGASDDHP
jgi:hypothetical protein